jgi:dihydroflavonol-4-reductase
MSAKRVVVTGASGLLGGNLAIELVKAGHHVRATRRTSTKIDHLKPFDIEWVKGDISDPTSLEQAFVGADAVFHCAAAVSIERTASPNLVKTNVEGTQNVIRAIQKQSVARLVHCSTVGAVGLSEDGRPCTEDSPWNFDKFGMNDGYVKTKLQAEQLVQEAVKHGLDAVIANPSYMFGPYDRRPSSGRMIVDVIAGRVPGWTLGWNNFVDVRDVARGMMLVWQQGQTGQRYILGGENLTYQEIFTMICNVAGIPAPRFRIPKLVSQAFGMLGDFQESLFHKEPLLNRVSVGYAYCPTFIFSSQKAISQLGYTTSALDIAIEDAILWFQENQMLNKRFLYR